MMGDNVETREGKGPIVSRGGMKDKGGKKMEWKKNCVGDGDGKIKNE